MSGRTLLQIYENPPDDSSVRLADNKGSPGIDPWDPDELFPDERLLPRHIRRDGQLAFKLRQFTASCLNSCGIFDGAPHSLMYDIHAVTKRALVSACVGDEVRNLDVFTHAVNYAREFVAAVDQLGPKSIQAVPCGDGEEGGGPLHRKVQREGVDRVLIQYMSVAAFERYEGVIQALAGEDGAGTELLFEAPEEGARSIVFKLKCRYQLGKRMVSTACSWAILLGGTKYMVFHLQEVDYGDECYHYLIISNCYPVFTAPPILSLSSVLIALLLSDDVTMAYAPPNPILVTKYEPLQPPVSESPGLERTQSDATLSPSGSVTPSTSTVTDVPTIFDQGCALLYPNSCLPDRETILTKVTSDTAFGGALNPVRRARHNPDIRTQGEGESEDEGPLLFAMERLHPDPLSAVYEAVFVADGHEEQPCAAKVVESEELNRFVYFQNEVGMYERLQGCSFIPTLYAAFATMWMTGPLGVIVTELVGRTFNSYSEMDVDEKNAALDCLEQLHHAGYHHIDT